MAGRNATIAKGAGRNPAILIAEFVLGGEQKKKRGRKSAEIPTKRRRRKKGRKKLKGACHARTNHISRTNAPSGGSPNREHRKHRDQVKYGSF